MKLKQKIFLACLGLAMAAPVSVVSAQDKVVMFPAEQFGRAYLVMPQSTMNLENVLGRNANFERLINYNATDQLRILANPVGRLDLLVKGSAGMGVATCTASIISRRYILTNNHCTPGDRKSAKVEAAHLLMDFYDEGREEQVRKFDVVLPPVEHDRKLDYAIFEIKGDPSATFGRVKLLPRDPEPGESLLIIHHPAGLPKHATRGGCRASSPRAVRDTDILHRCDTLPGSSGSPILASNVGAVIGIHYAGSSFAGPGSYNFGKRLKAIVDHSPIIKAILREDAEIAGREGKARAEREARARAEREAALRARLERELQDRLERELKAQEDKFKSDRAAEQTRLRAELEEETRKRLERELASKNATQQARLREEMEREMRSQFEARLKRDSETRAAELRNRLESELRAQMEDKLRSQSQDDQARLKAQLEDQLTRQIEDRFKTENAVEQAKTRARLERELKAEMEQRLKAEARARQAALEGQVKDRVDAELQTRLAAREATLRAKLERELRQKIMAELPAPATSSMASLGGTAPRSLGGEAPGKYVEPKIYRDRYEFNGTVIPLPSGPWHRLLAADSTNRRGEAVERQVLVRLEGNRVLKLITLFGNKGKLTRPNPGRNSSFCKKDPKSKAEYYVSIKGDREHKTFACWKFRGIKWTTPTDAVLAANFKTLGTMRDSISYFLEKTKENSRFFGFQYRIANPDRYILLRYLNNTDLHLFDKNFNKGTLTAGRSQVVAAGTVIRDALSLALRGESPDFEAAQKALDSIK